MRAKALFLDRDGVIVNWVHYLSSPNDVQLKEGLVDLLLRAEQQGYLVIEVTNQSGLGRGLFSLQDYERVQAKISDLLGLRGAKIDQVYMSPYFAGGTSELAKMGEDLRKPKPGMFHAAAKDFGLDLTQSVMVGDSATDIESAHNAGIKNCYFLMGHESAVALERSRAELKKIPEDWAPVVIDSLSQVKLK